MGMYDTVNVPCPSCGAKQEAQSKSGDCILRNYELDTCPIDVLVDVNRHSPFLCSYCGTVFEIKIAHTYKVYPVKLSK